MSGIYRPYPEIIDGGGARITLHDNANNNIVGYADFADPRAIDNLNDGQYITIAGTLQTATIDGHPWYTNAQIV